MLCSLLFDQCLPSYINQVDLYSGCVAKCGSYMADYTSFNYTSALFGEVEDTSTSQIFS
jgi:hypothetical protein